MLQGQIARLATGHEERSRVKLYLPSMLTALRITLLPILVACFIGGNIFLAMTLFLGAIATDILDGHLARKFRAMSEFGARFDVTADFVFICGMFIEFAREGLIPAWVLVLIIFMFAQFLITSKFKKLVYDPVGKYYGSILFGSICLIILFPYEILCVVVIVTIIGATGLSLSSRCAFFLKEKLRLQGALKVNYVNFGRKARS